MQKGQKNINHFKSLYVKLKENALQNNYVVPSLVYQIPIIYLYRSADNKDLNQKLFLGIQHAGEEIEEAPDAPLHDPLAHCSNITQLFQQNFTVSEFVQMISFK